MQRCLVGDGSVDGRAAIALMAEAEPVEPGGPPLIEVPLEPDLVPSCLAAIACRMCRLVRSSCVWSSASPGAGPTGVTRHNVEEDVMSAHHHMW
jgi:hypothetical protein